MLESIIMSTAPCSKLEDNAEVFLNAPELRTQL